MDQLHTLFNRDINQRVANEGVARVWDEGAIVEELQEYVLTEAIEQHLVKFLASFVESMEARKKGQGRDGMAVWVSGFFGSGKSHFAKVLGYLLGNSEIDADSKKSATDLFLPHLDGSPNETEIKGYLHQINNMTWVHPILLEIKSKENLTNPNSVAEICLSSFYEGLGYSRFIYVARIEKMLDERGVYEDFKAFYQSTFSEPWEVGRDKHMFNRRRIAETLQHSLPTDYPTLTDAEKAFQDQRDLSSLTVETFSEELLAYIKQQQKAHPQRLPHVIFILDEVQQFVGDNGQKILELQSIVERLGSMGKGQVWVVATGQERLDAVIDRTNIKLSELGKLTGRFSDRFHLSSEDVRRVVRDRLLMKRPSKVDVLKDLYKAQEGFFADLCRLNTERQLPGLNEPDFVAYYPFLPYQPSLAQEIFDTMRGIRISGSERSMLTVTQGILKKMAPKPIGALVPLDLVFDEIETELCSSDYLGSDGVRTVREADQRLQNWTVSPTRVLKTLWLINRLSWIPSSAETITRMLVDTTGEDIAAFRTKVTETLALLQQAGYISLDEGKGLYKYLTSEEGEVEKALIDKIASYGAGTSLAMRKAKGFARDRVLTRTKVGEFRVSYGKHGLFDFTAMVDGEEAGGKGEVRIDFYGPLSTVNVQALSQANLAQGEKGKIIFWVAKQNPMFVERMKRIEALVWLTTDASHNTGRSQKYLEAVDEKRKELSGLEETATRQIEDAFKEGQAFYSGEEPQLDGKKELRATIKEIFQTVAPNLYDRFADADKDYDLKALEKFLQPTMANLHNLCPDLNLFDARGQLQTHSPLVDTILDELTRRDDEGEDLQGDAIQSHFERIPYGWPPDLVRLVMAALLRGGAIAIVVGGKKIYDYTDSDALEALSMPTKFRTAKLLSIKTGLSPSQIKEARSQLVALGVTSVQESANDLARAIRQESTRYIERADKARTLIQYGLPLPDTYQRVETTCRPLEKQDDPTIVVTDFLNKKDTWKELKSFFDSVEAFTKDGKEKRFLETQRLATVCRDNAPLVRSAHGASVSKELADLDAVVAVKEVISDWTTYSLHSDTLLIAYRTAYQTAYGAVAAKTTALRAEMEALSEWPALKPERQTPIRQQYLDSGGKVGLPTSLPTASLSDLLIATAKYSLTTLEALEAALPSHRTEIGRAIRDAYAEQMEEEGKPKPKVQRWSSGGTLAGKTFTPDKADEVDRVFAAVSAEVKALLSDGFTVVID